MKSRSVITLLVGVLLVISMATAVYAGSADTVALNGKIYTVNPKQPWAEAVAIKGTDIVYVGDNEGSKAFIGKETTVADLNEDLPMLQTVRDVLELQDRSPLGHEIVLFDAPLLHQVPKYRFQGLTEGLPGG